ncbi:hypothetical protein BDZ94DRAFT_1257368 [Collybia nuda]|uniref:Uncharacterized protein n=1 Tax=Collybia nuda TaxID=64659 RepID=A0A9P5Y836_9AGAR|nr:hypothetical protein BDZ94DRAFT_1257368 [Collybia nuda]
MDANYLEEKVPAYHPPIPFSKPASHDTVAPQKDNDPRTRQRGGVAKAAFAVTTLWIVYIIYLSGNNQHRGSWEGLYSLKSFEVCQYNAP